MGKTALPYTLTFAAITTAAVISVSTIEHTQIPTKNYRLNSISDQTYYLKPNQSASSISSLILSSPDQNMHFDCEEDSAPKITPKAQYRLNVRVLARIKPSMRMPDNGSNGMS